MNHLGNKYAVAALRERRAALAGEIAQLESRVRHLKESLVHVDGALGLFDPDGNPTAIKDKKPRKRVKLFGAGRLNQLVLDALRRGARPMRTQEVIADIVADLRYGPEAAEGMKGRVRANLLYLKQRGVVAKEGERETATWRLA